MMRMREAFEGGHRELTQNQIHTLKTKEKSFIGSPFLTKYLSINSPCGVEEKLRIMRIKKYQFY
jgi:hypothetical protein